MSGRENAQWVQMEIAIAVDAKGAVGGTPFRFAHFGHAIKNGPLSLAGETKGRLFEYIGAI